MKRAAGKLWLVLLLLTAGRAHGQGTFANPVIAHGADPSMVFVEGMYYSVSSGCHDSRGSAICIRASATLPGLAHTAPVTVWVAPPCEFNGSVPNCSELWAPQIDFLNGRFYIYYAGSSKVGRNDHLLFALIPTQPRKPLEPWVEAPTGAPHGMLVTDWKAAWGIDPDVFLASDKHFYLLYACRQNNSPTRAGMSQSICLSAMSDPLHLEADPRDGAQGGGAFVSFAGLGDADVSYPGRTVRV